MIANTYPNPKFPNQNMKFVHNSKTSLNTKVPKRYVYFSSIFSSSSSFSSLLHSIVEARAMFWGVVGLKTTKKRGLE